MGHIINKVILYLTITFLSEDNYNCKNECEQKDKSKDDRWDHKAYTREDVIIHFWEMYLNNPHSDLQGHCGKEPGNRYFLHRHSHNLDNGKLLSHPVL